MITTRCGLDCENCKWKEECGCGGCIQTGGNPFHGECRLAKCCQEKGHVHCGECGEFPCELLISFSNDEENGDNPPFARIEVCRRQKEIQNSRYPWLCEYCGDKPAAEHDFKVEWQWRRYMVDGKMYAAVCKNDEDRDYLLTVKLPPDLGEALRARYQDIIPGYYMNKIHWNSVRLDGVVPDDLVKDMIDKSYELIIKGLSKKRQREISELR